MDKSAPEMSVAIEERLKENALRAYKALPSQIKGRVRSLKNLGLLISKSELDFHRELLELERKYNTLYAQISEKRRAIVSGKHEPSSEEAAWNYSDDDESNDANDGDDATKQSKKTSKIELVELEEQQQQPNGAEGDTQATKKATNGGEGEAGKEEVKGIPDFWLTTLSNVEETSSMIFPRDEAVLKHMTDLTVTYPTDNVLQYQLEFHFEENPYFSNEKLTKVYELKNELPKKSPFAYQGPFLVRSKGCDIAWKDGKNVTVKKVKIAPKTKSGKKNANAGAIKWEPTESFFNYFRAETLNLDLDDLAEEIEEEVEQDFTLGELYKEIARDPVGYFTGDKLESYDDEGDDDEDEENDQNDEEFDEDGEDDDGRRKNNSNEELDDDGYLKSDNDDDDEGSEKKNKKSSKAGQQECAQQ